jgi:hypothetical protein
LARRAAFLPHRDKVIFCSDFSADASRWADRGAITFG